MLFIFTEAPPNLWRNETVHTKGYLYECVCKMELHVKENSKNLRATMLLCKSTIDISLIYSMYFFPTFVTEPWIIPTYLWDLKIKITENLLITESFVFYLSHKPKFWYRLLWKHWVYHRLLYNLMVGITFNYFNVLHRINIFPIINIPRLSS